MLNLVHVKCGDVGVKANGASTTFSEETSFAIINFRVSGNHLFRLLPGHLPFTSLTRLNTSLHGK